MAAKSATLSKSDTAMNAMSHGRIAGEVHLDTSDVALVGCPGAPRRIAAGGASCGGAPSTAALALSMAAITSVAVG
jgi:hypothetical protein